MWLILLIPAAGLSIFLDIEACRHTHSIPFFWLGLVFTVIGASLMLGLLGLWMLVRWLCNRRNLGRTLVGAAVLATAVAMFYLEEDWRGKHDWSKYKAELEAKGAVLDWEKYIPPHVPDDQNFFTVNTNFYLRFVKQPTPEQSDAAQHLPWLQLSYDFPQSNLVVVAEVTVVSSNASTVPNDADLYLHYDHSVLTTTTPGEDFSEPPSPLIPVIDLKDVPLKTVIKQVAQVAHLNCTIDPAVKETGPGGKPILVSIRWENITARQALFALLDNFNLVLLEDSQTGAARVLPRKGQVYVEPNAIRKISNLISGVLEQSTNGTPGTSVQGCAGFTFFLKSAGTARPAHIVLRADEIPGPGEMSEMFLKNGVKSTGSNSFEIYGSPMVLSAEDYLAWSDQYVPAFDDVRAALQRPYAIIPGAYVPEYAMPIPNFVTMRALAQQLGQRAQCDLLLGRPEAAWHELSLIHDVCRILQKPPTGKPETLVEAMINVAISGLYVAIVQDGLHRHAWQEPQLTAIQQQLAGTSLIPWVSEAFREEQVHTITLGERENFLKIISGEVFGAGQRRSFWEKFPDYIGYELMPRGWVYQNIKCAAQLEQTLLGCLDESNDQVYPEKARLHSETVSKALQVHSVFHLLANVAIPNFSKAMQTCAYNQTLANEGQIACALERYHLANGSYPETLDALTPQFIEKIPHDIIGGQPLHYRRAEDGSFLLYSVGWNETDDGGTPGTLKDVKIGDWVWKN